MADELVLIVLDIVGVSAENASRLVLLEDDLILVNKDFDRVTTSDVHGVSDLNREYDSSKFVNLSNNACRFHKKIISPCFY